MKLNKSILLVFIILVCCMSTFDQHIVINEVMSAIVSTITDEDGDYSNWIELFNADSLQINLKNLSFRMFHPYCNPTRVSL